MIALSLPDWQCVREEIKNGWRFDRSYGEAGLRPREEVNDHPSQLLGRRGGDRNRLFAIARFVARSTPKRGRRARR